MDQIQNSGTADAGLKDDGVDTSTVNVESKGAEATADKAGNDELKKVISQRDKFKQQVKELQEVISAKESAIAELSPIRDDYEKVKKEVETLRKSNIQLQVVGEITGEVNPLKRKEAQELVGGWLASGKLSADKDPKDLVEAAKKQLADLAPDFFVADIHNPVNSTNPGVDWNNYKDWNQIPADLRKFVPGDVFKRLIGRGGTNMRF